MTDLLNIAYVQHDIKWLDIDANLRQYDSFITDIDGADIIVLPEMFATGFTNQLNGTAQPMNGPLVDWMLAKAAQKNAAIVGSHIITDGTNYYNRMLMAMPDGQLEWYDKRHLFRMGFENDTLTAGTQQKIVSFRGWNICLAVCYDLRFPVWLRNTGNNYDLLICVTNWPTARHESFETLLRARAIENQCYVVGVNRIGTDGLDIDYSGGSAVIDIYGGVMSQLQKKNAGIGRATLSLNKLNAFRNSFPTILDADKFTLEP